MLFTFLNHQWKEFWRGRNKAGGIAVRIIMGILILYFLLVAIGLGLFLDKIINEVFPGSDPISIFNGFILYYFMGDFLLRIQLQELPTLSVQPYLHLNIRKRTLVEFLNLRSLFSFFNVFPLFIFLPFTFSFISSTLGIAAAWYYFIIIISWILFGNYLVLYLKRKAISHIGYIAVGVVLVLGFAALEYFKIISLTDIADSLFRSIIEQPVWVLVFPLAAIGIYTINSRFLYSNLYVEELSKKEKKKISTDYPFLNRFGKTGQLAALELKLILRHKRSRSSLMMSFLFVLYGFLFYKSSLIESNSFASLMFAAIFMTGIFMIVYGQYMFAWQSGHFDGLMSAPIDFKKFIQAKFLLFTLSSTFITLITFLYGFLSWKLILMHLVIYLYNIGFGTVIVLFFASYNYKRLELTKGASFNWQGVSATQWLLGLPLIALPFIIYLPFGIYDLPFWGLAAIGIFGLITLVMRNFWLEKLTQLFISKRYKIADGFRE